MNLDNRNGGKIIPIRKELWRPASNGLTEPFSPFGFLSYLHDEEEYKRASIQNILDSYQESSDFLVELLQNAADAVEYRVRLSQQVWGEYDPEYRPQIWVVVDFPRSEIRVIDNGLGLAKRELVRMLLPSMSFKRDVALEIGRGLRGHKGVGADYLAFGFDYMRVSTKGEDGFLSFELPGGRRWAMGERGAKEPEAQPATETCALFNRLEMGTAVTLRLSEGCRPSALSRLGTSPERWEMNLRVRTAVGFIDLAGREKWHSQVAVNLILVYEGGRVVSAQVPFSYPLPSYIPNYDFLDLGDYYRNVRAGEPVAPRYKNKDAIFRTWTARELFDPKHGLVKREKYALLGKELLAAYAFFSHSARLYDSLSEAAVGGGSMRPIRPGVWIAARNALIGRPIPLQLTFGAGNQDRLFMIAELDDVRPDLGRKGFSNDVADEVRRLGSAVIDYFVTSTRLIHLKPAGAHAIASASKKAQHMRLREAEERADKYPLSGGYSLLSIPRNEAETVALMHELMGSGMIPCYRIYDLSGHATYDGIFSFEMKKDHPMAIYDPEHNPLGLSPAVFARRDTLEHPPGLLEYKFNLDCLIEEVGSIRSPKAFEQIDMVICWETGSRWQKSFDLLDLTEDGLVGRRELFGATGLLMRKAALGGHAIHVIELKKVLGVLARTDSNSGGADEGI